MLVSSLFPIDTEKKIIPNLTSRSAKFHNYASQVVKCCRKLSIKRRIKRLIMAMWVMDFFYVHLQVIRSRIKMDVSFAKKILMK